MHSARKLVVAVACSFLATVPAGAATIRELPPGRSRHYAGAYYTAWPGERNSVKLTDSSKGWVFSERRAPVHAGRGCASAARSVVRCKLGVVASVRLRDGADHAVVAGRVREGARIYGGAGDDRLFSRIAVKSPNDVFMFGGDGRDRMVGGLAGDVLFGGAGNDRLSGGGGDDSLIGGPGADLISGGAGTDSVSYARASAGVVVTLDGGQDDGPRNDAKDLLAPDIENVGGSSYDDLIVGTDGPNELLGNWGRDEISGRGGDDRILVEGGKGSVVDGGDGADEISVYSAGSRPIGDRPADRLTGGAGDDTFDVFNGMPDVVDCGAGIDSVSGDQRDAIAEDCEQVTVREYL